MGLTPNAIVAGDFNGDGVLDLAIADSGSNQVSILLGNGGGTFQPGIQYATDSYPDALAAGDFNGDGKLDLVAANQGGDDVSILLGNGDGTLIDASQFVTTTSFLASGGRRQRRRHPRCPGRERVGQHPLSPGHPRAARHLRAAASLSIPVIRSRDIAWLPNTSQGPVLASVDAQDNAIIALRLPRRRL